MHPNPRQNTTFSGLSGVYDALFTAPHRFSFNGQERTDEIAGTGNHTTALYWEYDTSLRRRWNVDPKGNTNVGSYTVFANNPILVNDPLGDTTYIYNIDGEYKGVILDRLPLNENVFMLDEVAENILCIDKILRRGHNRNALEAQKPNVAYARFTGTTRDELYKSYESSRSNPKGWKEPVGVLWIDPETNEWHAWTNTNGEGSITGTFNPLYIFKGGWNSKFLGIDACKGEIFALWHGHNSSSFQTTWPSEGADDQLPGGIWMNKAFARFENGFTNVIVSGAAITFLSIGTVFNNNNFPAQFGPNVKALLFSPEGKPIQYGSYNRKTLSFKTKWNY